MKTAPLSELASLEYGFAFDSKQFNAEARGLPLVRIRDVMPGRSSTYYAGNFNDRYLVGDGEYLIGMDGQFNIAPWRGGTALLNQRVCRICALAPSIERGYLVRFMPRALKAIEDETPFVTVKHLSAKALMAIKVPLPPLHEQRRIAAILDHADALRVKRRQILAHLGKLAESTFTDMFGHILEGSNTRKLGDVARIIRGASPRPAGDPRYFGGPIPWLKISDITAAHGATVTRIKETVTEAGRDRSVFLPANTLVLSNSATVGIAKIVEPPTCIHDGFLAFLDLAPDVDQRWLRAALASIRPYLVSLAPEGTQKNLNGPIVKAVKIHFPSLRGQLEFTKRVHEVNRQSDVALRSRDAFDALFAALQFRAFRGEL